MFADLLDQNIQPKEIDAKSVAEIRISDSLEMKIQKMLEKEEKNYAKVYEHTSVVQTDKNFVFFSNHWLYLAVLCKKYAEALRPYADFFDEKVRGNAVVLKALAHKEYDAEELTALLPDSSDRDKMIKFIMSDSEFRPGKCLINGEDGEKVRSTKDIMGSCILKKIPVPDASSAYLGNLIYYLTQNAELFNELEKEIKRQMGDTAGCEKLPSTVKECAKQIIDSIYRIDKFKAIENLFSDTGHGIKIKTESLIDIIPSTQALRYVFMLPASDMYHTNSDVESKTRVFEKEYKLHVDEQDRICRLTTEWVGKDLEENCTGNYLRALVRVVNRFYSEYLEIKSDGEGYCIKRHKNTFVFDDLPDDFKTDYSRRYITSLLAKPFVILTGNSGTGKTRISKQFSEYMEVITENGEKNWLIVPVGADWTDNSKILGFYNPLADNGVGKYEKTSIVKLIESANRNKNIPFFLILDEMNLSHVERYFSDFLSHMETPDSSFVIDGYCGELEFPENLFVVGTVNIDETTYMFSPKVLDRANVVEFKPGKEDVLSLFTKTAQIGNVSAVNDGSAEAFLKLALEIRHGKFEAVEEVDNERMLQELQQVFGLIYDAVEKNGFEFAYRTVREIRQYIAAAKELSGSEFDFYKSVDEQLLQKVLPKIHGNRKEIGLLLDELGNICAQTKIPLELSARKIEQMKGKLATVQYASFI